MNNELTYWVALAHTPKIWTARKNEIIVFCRNHCKSIADFFSSNDFLGMELSLLERELLQQTKTELVNYAFMVEALLNQGYDIIPVVSGEYSPTLKRNLKYASPIVLYTKGNKQILQEQSIAIVGSRNANEYSLQFTDNVAKKASAEYKVVVSGFAKGVDKQALDSALAYKGQSIIVLPQGITTFSSGMKKYYKQIIAGDVLVLSTFYPKLPWSVDLAMARNSIIYGLASEIYAAQSDDKGGTWSGVTEGLKKGRVVYVRIPEQQERCANKLLISMGAIPVDMNGDVAGQPKDAVVLDNPTAMNVLNAATDDSLEQRIREVLSEGVFSTKQLADRLGLSFQKLTPLLKKMEGIVQVKEGKKVCYSLVLEEHSKQLSLML